MTVSAVGLRAVEVTRNDGVRSSDVVAVEAPLEIRVGGQPLVITMRTPGHDEELAAGFLFGEGVITSGGQVDSIRHEPGAEATSPEALAAGQVGGGDRVLVTLQNGADVAGVERAQRHFRATAACGVCGKESLDDLDQALPAIEARDCPTQLLASLPDRMRPHQPLFDATGGIHAAGLFTLEGELLTVREDIGRHNAVDKVIGRAVLDGATSLSDRILVVSGRAGFELVQKALKAAIPIMVSVGAASSLAVEMAAAAGMTLYSFVGPGRGNLHT
ncbi:MAG: sulfurtransferase FdhD [Rhodospirillaceae bacterium]|nr:sulfurtransferase FdhD [Rhodospirillaceae bacterium]|tara:strand:- start:1071 stop:1892 length:822 start_codon:yes stop_codon:yes gene_type:complete